MSDDKKLEGYWILAEKNIFCTWTYSVYLGEKYLAWFFKEDEAQTWIRERKEAAA